MNDNRIRVRELFRFGLAAVVALGCAVASLKADNHGRSDHPKKQNQLNRYEQVNLVSDQAGVALLQDTDLVNAWGMSFSATSPFWVSDNGTGKATIYAVTYNASGQPHVVKQGLFVTIPGEGNPSGQVFNNTGAFHGDIFIFVSEDGTISGWRPALGTTPGVPAEVLVSKETAVYKGVTIVTTSTGPRLLAANFSEAKIDAYDMNLNRVQYGDPGAPDGYAPFNVQELGGTVYVTFAKQNDEKMDDVPGPGNGFIDTFDPETGSFARFASGSNAGGRLKEINAPWGLALAPSSFGKHGGELLVGNFGSGTIMGFDPDSGKFRGLLKSDGKGPVTIDGLWAIAFGNGGNAGRPNTLYFTAGPDDETHGLFGSLDAVKNEGKGKNKGGKHDNDDDEEDED